MIDRKNKTGKSIVFKKHLNAPHYIYLIGNNNMIDKPLFN
jgi:hypothetical protein